MAITLNGTQGTTTPGLYSNATFTGTYSDGIVLDYTTGLGRVSVGSADGVAFYNGGVATTELMRLDSSGNLGIGTSSPTASYKLTLTGGVGLNIQNTGASDNSIVKYSNSGKNWYVGLRGDTSNVWAIADDSAFRLTLDTSGNLGIGTTSPAKKLDVVGQAQVRPISNANNAADWFAIGSVQEASSFGVGVGLFVESAATNAYAMTFGTKPNSATAITERARIDSSGNLLVGTTSAGDGKVRISASANAYNLLKIDDTGTTGGNYVQFLNSSGAQAGSINHNGTTSVNYGSGSDQRLKENIVDAPSALASVNAIKVRSFDWKSDGLHVDYGYIAQELLEVVPEAVHVPVDPEETLCVDFGKLTPRIIKALQELTARLEALENK